MGLLPKFLCLFALLACAPLAHAQIYHCIGVHGEPVFSGQPCGNPAPSSSNADAASNAFGGACAASPRALRQAIGNAYATLQPPTGFEISTAEGGTRDFGVTEFGGCWWLTFGVSDARFRAAPRASIPTPPARQGAFRNLMLKLLCALAVIVLTANACSSGRHAVIADAGATPAAAVSVTPAVRDAITAAVTKMAPGAKVQRVAPMPIAGLYQVVSQGQVLYMTGDGRYVIQGDAYDIATRTPLNSLTMNRLRREAIAKLSPAGMIRFAPANPKYTVTVFTDI